ncbi:MAG: ABC transporter permease [Deltaproteobacteria bacterium]|nr:ABC transporter permease [Deltaproteobacteria bacterium]
MLERLKRMLIKEFLQIFRDPRMRVVIFVLPAIQVLVFGYAASNDVRDVPTALFDQDQTVASRELASRFEGSGYFDVVEHVSTEARARELLDRGEATALLRVDRGFSEDLAGGRTASVQLILDGTDSNTAAIVLDYAARIVRRTSAEVQQARAERLLGAMGPLPGVELATRAWFNENLESRLFYVPGVIANLVLIITLMLTSMAVVREKEIGTMEQILVTPIRPLELILGKTIPFALIGFADVFLISLVGVFWFGIPIRGNPAVLLLGTGLFLMSTLGAGLFISTVSQTQQQAMMTTFFYAFPAILLSGFAFPIANMPEPVQWITYLNPLRYYLVILRGVFLKGVGIGVLWPQMVGLAVLGPITLALASTRFQKTLG